VVVFNEAHSLSKDAQHALRRTMEKYVANLRVILCSNSTSRILDPIRSRCLLVRVPAPSTHEVLLTCYLRPDVASFTQCIRI
jgi:replication factor C subunit 3/5